MVTVPGVGCVVFPSDFAVNVKVRVFVNGKQTIVPAYATVGDLIDTDSLPKTLLVKRIFEDHLIRVNFDPHRNTILKLAVMPGDRITW